MYYCSMGIKGFEKFSLLDYDDKVSATLFFNGCNMRCPFCHNSSLVLGKDDREDIPFDDVYEYLIKRRKMVDAVTISGGEPTLVSNLKDIIKKIKELGYLVKLDTNGTHPEVISDLLNENLLDFIAMDIKNSIEKYPLTAGRNINMDNIKKSISLIMNSGVDYEFRTTIIKEHHSLEDMKDIALLIKGAKKYRLQKFVDHGTCIENNLHEIDKDEALTFVDFLKGFINDVNLRGY